jgi:hypothetical protein
MNRMQREGFVTLDRQRKGAEGRALYIPASNRNWHAHELWNMSWARGWLLRTPRDQGNTYRAAHATARVNARGYRAQFAEFISPDHLCQRLP